MLWFADRLLSLTEKLLITIMTSRRNRKPFPNASITMRELYGVTKGIIPDMNYRIRLYLSSAVLSSFTSGGHFIVARYSAFASTSSPIGFGPALRLQVGATDWRISASFSVGYVRLADRTSSENRFRRTTSPPALPMKLMSSPAGKAR